MPACSMQIQSQKIELQLLETGEGGSGALLFKG